MGLSRSTLLDIYMIHVRSVVEFAAVVWHSGLTKDNTEQIERVQKAAFAIILGENYKNYENACSVLSMHTWEMPPVNEGATLKCNFWLVLAL